MANMAFEAKRLNKNLRNYRLGPAKLPTYNTGLPYQSADLGPSYSAPHPASS